MSVISMKQLLEAGVHFGHQTRRWNPKMAPYIYTERNGIYIIDLQKSVGMVDTAYKAVSDIVAEGGTILFVGKSYISPSILQRTNPCFLTSFNSFTNSPFLPRAMGDIICNFVPSGSLQILSVIWSTVCCSITLPQTGQCAIPILAQSRRR